MQVIGGSRIAKGKLLVTPLGANLVLLEGQEDGEVQALMDDAKGWLDQWFKHIRPWRPQEVDMERVIWLRVFGVPSHAWNDLFFAQLVKPWGVFLNSDDGTSKKITMDVARLLIRTSCQNPVNEFFDVLVNGEIFRLRVLEDSYGPMRIIVPHTNNTHGGDKEGPSEEDEEEGEDDDEEEVAEIRQLMEEEVAERETDGEERNLLALNSNVNALNDQDNLSVAANGVSNERENNQVLINADSNFLSINSGDKGVTLGGESMEINNLVKDKILTGQEVVVDGPQNIINNQIIDTGGTVSRLGQSDIMGLVQCSEPIIRSGGGKKQLGGVYSDGPRQVYSKLNNGPTLITDSSNQSPVPIFSKMGRVHPIPAGIRKQQKLINNLHLRTPASSSTHAEPTLMFPGKEVSSSAAQHRIEGVTRILPQQSKSKKKQESSISSAGEILCCSSLNSSDIRNCNKRFVANFNHQAAQKVWKGATDLGVVGDEGAEVYVKRILINENKEEEARILREQHPQCNP
jgi:hypothetical protein